MTTNSTVSTGSQAAARWRAVVARDRSQDGRWVYGVASTGIYCRPGCPSRRPLRRHVRFYADAATAERAGLRACRRCRPQEPGTGDAAMRALCRHLEVHCDEPVPLAELAARAGLSASRLQRRFTAAIGVSPKRYQQAARLRRLKGSLRAGGVKGDGVTEAIYEAGYGSASRVYEQSAARLGMTPRQYAAGGRGVEIRHAFLDTPAGRMLLAASARGLCFAGFGGMQEMKAEFPEAVWSDKPSPLLRRWSRALAAWFRGRAIDPSLPLDLRGTAFQARVWEYLRRLPRGETRSYGAAAAELGRPAAARAVARACAANRLAIAVPCHRVVKATGAPGGYRWGAERKARLLQLEKARA